MRIIIAVAVIPALALIYFIYSQDKIEQEPFSLLFKLFFFGGLTTISASILEQLGAFVLDQFYVSEMTALFIENFLIVAIAEEGGKHFVLRRQTWENPAFDYLYDGVVYATTVSLGFGAFENVLYVMSYGLSIAPLRAFTAIPLHCIVGVYMGHYYGEARREYDLGNEARGKQYMFLSMLVPVLIHGFYDFVASMDNSYSQIIFLIFVILLDIRAYRSVKRYAREDARA